MSSVPVRMGFDRRALADQLKESGTIKQPPTTQNTFGEVKELDPDQYTALATVRCSVNPERGREFLATSGKIDSQTVWHVRIRHRTDVTAKMIFVWDTAPGGAKTFNIESVLPSRERKKFLDLMCLERGA